MSCDIEGCSEPRHVSRTGTTTTMLCDAHERMHNVLEQELWNRRRLTAGATDLLRGVEADPDKALTIIEEGLRRLAGSSDGAPEVVDHLEHARDGIRWPDNASTTQRRASPTDPITPRAKRRVT